MYNKEPLQKRPRWKLSRRTITRLDLTELPAGTQALARFLLGKLVIRELPEGQVSGRIVETEAYLVGDAASHTFRGMTARNRSMFLERGHAYVYLVYGTSFMLNVSSEEAETGEAVLIPRCSRSKASRLWSAIAVPPGCTIWPVVRADSHRLGQKGPQESMTSVWTLYW